MSNPNHQASSAHSLLVGLWGSKFAADEGSSGVPGKWDVFHLEKTKYRERPPFANSALGRLFLTTSHSLLGFSWADQATGPRSIPRDEVSGSETQSSVVEQNAAPHPAHLTASTPCHWFVLLTGRHNRRPKQEKAVTGKLHLLPHLRACRYPIATARIKGR